MVISRLVYGYGGVNHTGRIVSSMGRSNASTTGPAFVSSKAEASQNTQNTQKPRMWVHYTPHSRFLRVLCALKRLRRRVTTTLRRTKALTAIDAR